MSDLRYVELAKARWDSNPRGGCIRPPHLRELVAFLDENVGTDRHETVERQVMHAIERTEIEFPLAALPSEVASEGAASDVFARKPNHLSRRKLSASRDRRVDERQVLCVGIDPMLLYSRCLVLDHAGYRCAWATPFEVEERLRADKFDLIILSTGQAEAKNLDQSLSFSWNVPTLQVENFSHPRELLKAAEELLTAMRASESMQCVGSSRSTIT